MSGPARPLASTLPPAEGVLGIGRRYACLGRKTRILHNWDGLGIGVTC
jgi:hypothetical protein